MAAKKEAYFLLRNTHDIKTKDAEEASSSSMQESENIEEDSIKSFSAQNPALFNKFILQIMGALSTEKQEGETVESFTNMLLDETRKIFSIS